ncbi:MAG TPA: hypothetical protein VEU74_12065 [Gemmatimonadales bacterium]|nr:hypothetical protein [Gemmatimonadales bacterium]
MAKGQEATITITRPEPEEVRSSVKTAAAAAQQAIREGKLPSKMGEPVIGEGDRPRTGAGPNEGERAPAENIDHVTLLEDEEVDRLARDAEREERGEEGREEGRAEEGRESDEERPSRAEEGRQTEGTEDAREEGTEGEPPIVELPPMREGETEPVRVQVDDEELASRIRALARGAIRRDQLHRAMQDVERGREEVAQVEDAIRSDPISFVAERLPEDRQLKLARWLMAQPHIYNTIAAEQEGLDEAAIRVRAMEAENDRLRGRSAAIDQMRQRSEIRERGRQVRAAINRIIPENMDETEASLLYKDLERDVSDYIIQNRVTNLRVAELPAILERRLALHGITFEEAAERLEESGIPPLPPAARAARGNGTPARREPRQTARTGKDLAAQAEARRRAGAVPGGGAGVPATGVVLPKRQGVKGRIQWLKEQLLGA